MDACKSEPVRVACRHVFRAEDGDLPTSAGGNEPTRARAHLPTTMHYIIIITILLYIYMGRYHLPYYILLYISTYVNTNNDNVIMMIFHHV